MLCTVSHQSYRTHQHVPQVAAKHLDLTSLENSVLLLLLLSLRPWNDSNLGSGKNEAVIELPVCAVYIEPWGVRILLLLPKAHLDSVSCFPSLLSWWMPSDGVLLLEWLLEWKLCAPQKTQCWSRSCVSLCCVTGKWSYQHVKCALPPLRSDSRWRAEWQEWLLKACRWSVLLGRGLEWESKSSVGIWSCSQLPCLS